MKKLPLFVFALLLSAGCSDPKQPPVPEDAEAVGRLDFIYMPQDKPQGNWTVVRTKKWEGAVEGFPGGSMGEDRGWSYVKDGQLFIQQPDGSYKGWKIKQ